MEDVETRCVPLSIRQEENMHPFHDILLKDLANDLREMVEAGHDQQSLQNELEQAKAAGSLDALARLQADWWLRPSPPGFPYEEPGDWASIRRCFPDPAGHAPFSRSDDELADRLLGAWLGRCAGCQLGKPLEGLLWPDKIESVLRAVSSWPLTDYMNPVPADLRAEQVPGCEFFQQNNAWRNGLCRGRFEHVSPDDDIHYAIIGLRLLELRGAGFTSQQAAENLLNHSPSWSLFAAGRNLYRTATFGVPAAYTAVMGNPCRQSLGAMIRCDPFGWTAPGNPALAAEMAYKDAVTSQRRNGIYAGIFFAVAMADVLAHGDIGRAIETARAYVPPRSRFAEMIAFVKQETHRTADWQAVNRAILTRWPGEAKSFNHSITNGAMVIGGLILGQGDFTKTLGTTVMCGVDTDCTGATAGSILGCALGTRGIPRHWTEPFHDMIRSDVRGLAEVRISELAKRTFRVAKDLGRGGSQAAGAKTT
jgi:ADP-ribosylglycohydrolase